MDNFFYKGNNKRSQKKKKRKIPRSFFGKKGYGAGMSNINNNSGAEAVGILKDRSDVYELQVCRPEYGSFAEA